MPATSSRGLDYLWGVKARAKQKLADINAASAEVGDVNYIDKEGVQTAKQLAYDIAPISGELIAARDSAYYADRGFKNLKTGQYLQAVSDYTNSVVQGIGAVPVLGEGARLLSHVPDLVKYMPSMGMTVFHGTPHKFAPTKKNPLGEFDLSKIGTGEGAQAYGHGIYVAEGKGTAKYYADAITPSEINFRGEKMTPEKYKELLSIEFDNPDAGEIGDIITRNIPQTADEEKTLIDNLADAFPSLRRSEIEGIAKHTYFPKGSLYEVDLPDTEIAKMLDWDKPLSEEMKDQILKQQYLESGYTTKDGKWFNHKGKEIRQELVEKQMKVDKEKMGREGQYIYGHISLGHYGERYKGDKNASAFLNRAGFPGLKYFDGTSRKAGEGTRNFVLFDPSIAKIIGKE